MTPGTRRVTVAANRGRRAEGRVMVVKVAKDARGPAGSISIAVPRRTGNAVRRNRIRRQIREILRLGSDRIDPEAHLQISVRMAGPSYGELELELWELLESAGALK